MYRDPETDLWYSKDKGHHKKDFQLKVHKKIANKLDHVFNADINGERIYKQHKGPIGRSIRMKDIIGCP
jgi:hypothetical protein